MSDTISRVLDLTRQADDAVATGTFRHVRVVDDDRLLGRSAKWNLDQMERSRLLLPVASQQVIDCYSLLRTRVLHRVLQGHYSTLGITSPAPQDGKTLTAVNLALSIATTDSQAVVLVDADVRRPSIAGLFGLSAPKGLGDYFAGDVALQDLLLRMPQSGLFVIPGSASSTLRPETLTSDKVVEFLRRLKRMLPQALIIVDMPPALVGGDVMVFAPNLDGTLLVVANRRTIEADFQQTMTLLEGVNVLGTVLNYAEETISRNEYYGGK